MSDEKRRETITDADIVDVALNPSSFSIEGLSQTNRDPITLYKLRRMMRKDRAASNPAARIFGTRVIPPGP